jgi:hypothetical protein
VGVVNEAVRKKSMQKNLNRGERRTERNFVNLKLIFHLLIANGIKASKLAQRFQLQTDKAGRLDGGQVDPAPLDEEDFPHLPQDISLPQLHGGIPSSVENKTWIRSEQTGSVNPQGQFRRNFRVSGDDRFCFFFVI